MNDQPMKPRGSITMAIMWMAVLSLLLFWLPLIGPLLAGFVGGRTAGGAGRGLMAALLPALLLSLFLFASGTALVHAPVIGLIAGAGLFLLLIVQGLPLLIGALIGGATV